jgi:hypothetical protein
MKHAVADLLARFLNGKTGEALDSAQEIAAIDLLLLAAHLHLASGRSEEHFLQRAFACLTEAQHQEGASPTPQ